MYSTCISATALFEAIEGLDYEQCLTLLQEHQIDLTR